MGTVLICFCFTYTYVLLNRVIIDVISATARHSEWTTDYYYYKKKKSTEWIIFYFFFRNNIFYGYNCSISLVMQGVGNRLD